MRDPAVTHRRDDSYDGSILSFTKFASATRLERHGYWPLFQFLDDLHFNTALRTDRFLSAHLILVAILNAFGYPYQRTEQSRIADVARRCKHVEVLRNWPNP